MAITLAFPYAHVHLVKLSDADFGKLDEATTITVGTVTDTSIPFTAPSDPSSLSVTDQKSVTVSIAETRNFEEISATTLDNSSMRTYQGRQNWEASMVVFRDDGSDLSPYLDDSNGHFFLYVERPDESGYAGIVDIVNQTEEPDESGRLTYTLTLKASGRHGVFSVS